jgi:NAD-dependent oxidoreductase involved in siderophore biosynthesis
MVLLHPAERTRLSRQAPPHGLNKAVSYFYLMMAASETYYTMIRNETVENVQNMCQRNTSSQLLMMVQRIITELFDDICGGNRRICTII